MPQLAPPPIHLDQYSVTNCQQQQQLLWSNRANIPQLTQLSRLKDCQLMWCLAHHKFVFHLPPDWYIDPDSGEHMAATIIEGSAHLIKGYHHIYCDFLLPDSAHNAGQQI
eukprot:492341-Rhodomonas_salina.3